MCLLTFLPAGAAPDLSALATGAARNPDGHGFAIVSDGGLLVERGLDARNVLTRFAAARQVHPQGPALFHSRIGTHGHLDLDNCHPFPVGGDPRTVIAHNGILPAAVRPRRGDRRSDTRIAAEQFIPALGSLHLRPTRLRLQRWMGPANLMVLLSVDRRYREQAYLFNEAQGTWDGGCWYSNDSYRPFVPVRLRRDSGDRRRLPGDAAEHASAHGDGRDRRDDRWDDRWDDPWDDPWDERAGSPPDRIGAFTAGSGGRAGESADDSERSGDGDESPPCPVAGVGATTCPSCLASVETSQTWCPWCEHCWWCGRAASDCDCRIPPSRLARA